MTSAVSQLRILPVETSITNEAVGTSQERKFSEVLRDAVDQVDLSQQDAQRQVIDLVTGGGDDLHSAAIAVEKADLSFQLMLQVRNKVIQAYQEISRMQF